MKFVTRLGQRHWIPPLVLLFLLTTLYSTNFIVSAINTRCRAIGECVSCAKSELTEEYCLSTGYKQEYQCLIEELVALNNNAVPSEAEWESKSEIKFQSCNFVDHETGDAKSVFVFEVFVLIIFVIAYKLLEIEKEKHKTIFDRRADPRATRSLINNNT